MSANLFSMTVMGGYQQIAVRITNIDISKITIEVSIGDIFGAGRGDANSRLPGLSDMFNLQHNYSTGTKYTPFRWSVNFAKTVPIALPTSTNVSQPQKRRN